jgi:hypothetical protein
MCQPTFLGCFSRSPDGSGGQEGPDDYTGVAAASPTFASFIVDYGRQRFWVYNNTNPGSLRTQAGDINWAAFFIRFPGLIAHLHYGANITPNWWLRQAWRLTVLWSALTASGQDDWILTWLLVVTAGEKSTLNRWCKRLWLHRLLKAYPGGINEVFKNYFGFQHPIAKWAKNE